MRKVTEKTFKAYAKEAVKQLNTLELFAALRFTAVGVEISLYRNGVEVGHISIQDNGWVHAEDLARDDEFEIIPEHDTMKDLFKAVYTTVNGLLDNGWFMQEEPEQVEEVTDEPKQYFSVTFEKNGIYSANIAHAVKKSDVEAHYSKYNNCVIGEAKGYEVEEAERKHMPIVEIEPVKEEAEEPQPTPEEADREVTYIDFKPEQDYSEEEPKAENSKVKAVAQYLNNKITGWYENARIDYGVNGKFLSCKAEGENGIRINWEENGKEYTMVINWFTEYTTEHLYNIWMEQGVEVEEVEKQPKEEEQQVVTIDNTQLFLKDFAKSLDAAGFATSYKELYQGTYSIHAIADQGVMVDVGFNEGVPCKTSASAVVYSGTDCIIIDCTKYNTEAEFIKAITEKVISASAKEKELFKSFFESTDSTDNKVRKLRKEFKQWELLQEREKEADEAYEANYKNKELEKAADEAFEVEYKQYDKIARMIAELINVEVLTAKSMLINRAERVKKILGL